MPHDGSALMRIRIMLALGIHMRLSNQLTDFFKLVKGMASDAEYTNDKQHDAMRVRIATGTAEP